MRKFAHLHCHTIYSINDGLAKIEEYILKMHKFNYENKGEWFVGIAATEHGNCSSILKLKQACETEIQINSDDIKRTMKPIYGVETYHSLNDTTTDMRVSPRKKKKKDELDIEDEFVRVKDRSKAQAFHLILLAKNEEGYSNLMKITSHAGLNSYTNLKTIYRTDLPFLYKHGRGIICSTACLGGYIPQLILNGEYDEAKKVALEFKEVFEHFYLELQANDIPEQLILNKQLLKLSNETGIDIIITCDPHYVDKEDRESHDILYKLANPNSKGGIQGYVHLKTPIEIEEYCIKHNIPLRAMDNTVKIADMCNVDFTPKDNKFFMPKVETPVGYTEETYLEKICFEKLFDNIREKKIRDNLRNRIKRLQYELKVINDSGFAGYFLIVSGFIQKCRDEGILIGPGRGSAAGSIIAYILKITNIDPICNEFLFERFLNPERVSAPDIDTDISSDRRSDAIKILLDTYGSDYVCQIITFNKHSLKTTIKSIFSYYHSDDEDYTEKLEEINNFTKKTLGTNTIGDSEITYDLLLDIYLNEETYEDKEGFEEKDIKLAKSIYEKLLELIVKYPELETGLSKLKGTIKSTGCHAGGVVISSKILKDYLPIAKASTDTAILPIVQLEMNDLDYFSILKLDALGLGTLTQLKNTLDLIGDELPSNWIDIEEFDDPAVYEFLRKGNTVNVFQMQKPQATRMLKDFKVNSLNDLSAVSAGVRPGLSNTTDIYGGKSPIDIYIEIKNGLRTKDTYGEPIDKILAKTEGVIWFQEDCQQIGQEMAGYSLGGADTRIRKTIAKKSGKNKIPEIRNEFIYGKKSLYNERHLVIGKSQEDSDICIGAINRGYSEELAIKVFTLIEAMAAYCFNKSHKHCGII